MVIAGAEQKKERRQSIETLLYHSIITTKCFVIKQDMPFTHSYESKVIIILCHKSLAVLTQSTKWCTETFACSSQFVSVFHRQIAGKSLYCKTSFRPRMGSS